MPNLTTGPIGPTLITFALPVLGTNVLQSLNGTANAVWVSHALGPAALTATTNANTIFFLMLGILFCAALIIQSRQEFGRQLLSFLVFIGAGSVALYGSLGAKNLTPCTPAVPVRSAAPAPSKATSSIPLLSPRSSSVRAPS